MDDPLALCVRGRNAVRLSEPWIVASEKEGKQTVTLAVLIADPVSAVAEVTKAAIKQLEESASLFVAGFGCVLMVYAAADVTILERHGFDRLSSGDFVALLISGLVLLFAGASFRMFLGYKQGEMEETYQEWLRERAGKEADVQIERAARLQEAATDRPTPTAPKVNP